DAGMHMKAFMDPSRIPLEWQIIFRKRFRKDVKSTFAGHSMSNIIMLALTEEYGLEGMFAMLGKMLGIKQRIIPISLDYSHVNALTDKGEIEGEAAIDTRSPDCPRVIRNIQLEPPARIYIKAAEAIEQADKLIWGPGDMRTSIRPITCVVGVKESVAKARQKRGTKVILVCNLMTKKSETPGYTTATFARELCESLGIEKLDYTLFNTKAIRQDVLASYAKDGQYPVRFENALECGTIYSGNFLEYDGEYHIRHSPQAVANAIALL
ncbi:MAG TPA: 2-phospho-L-lactate transferase CofD family protein, partial [Candidatus Nanoarchaeia archaeon]|nr:2-phospho-L-lactate transferase CofD family protein [Candidatus Nanoarchaeia archaeon]